MIPFFFGVTDDGTPVIWPVNAPAAVETMAQRFIDRGGRYVITDASATHIRVAAVVEGYDNRAHELTSEFAARSAANEAVDRLVEDSVRLISPVH